MRGSWDGGSRWGTSILLLVWIGLVLGIGTVWKALIPSILLAAFPAWKLGELLRNWGGAALFGVAVCVLVPAYPFADAVFAAVLLATFALFNWDAQRNLKQALQTDALTGLLNRKGFEESLAARLQKKTTSTQIEQVLIVCLDCDQFKSFNDTHGHRAGDELLVRAAESLRRSARDGLIGRLGGDEFAVAWVNPSLKDVNQIAASIQEHLHDLCSGQQYLLTWTLGVAGFTAPEVVPSGTFNQTPDVDRHAGLWDIAAMMDRADELMLSGKKGSGGGIVIEVDGVRLTSSDQRSNGSHSQSPQ